MPAKRKPKDERRFLNSEESSAMGFTEMQDAADEDGWPYPDDDDDETTERFLKRGQQNGQRYPS
jgi:hypothetical protein